MFLMFMSRALAVFHHHWGGKVQSHYSVNLEKKKEKNDGYRRRNKQKQETLLVEGKDAATLTCNVFFFFLTVKQR